jgi:hypothetical protein
LCRQIAHKIGDSRRRRFWFGQLIERSPQPLPVFPTMVGLAKLAILQLPKGADFLAAIQTMHAGTFGTI